MKTQVSEIKSLAIRSQAESEGITEIEILSQRGDGDSAVTIYQVGAVRVADTNGDPVWEESDPEGFAALMTGTTPNLHNYQTGDVIRAASAEELAASIEAAKQDGGAGVIVVDGVSCYVQE